MSEENTGQSLPRRLRTQSGVGSDVPRKVIHSADNCIFQKVNALVCWKPLLPLTRVARLAIHREFPWRAELRKGRSHNERNIRYCDSVFCCFRRAKSGAGRCRNDKPKDPHADCPMHKAHAHDDSASTGMNERGEEGMGFSQTATSHHFLLNADG